jgi:hypothetical protein
VDISAPIRRESRRNNKEEQWVITYFGASEGVLEDGRMMMFNGVHASIDNAFSSFPTRLLYRKYPPSLLGQLGPGLQREESRDVTECLQETQKEQKRRKQQIKRGKKY